MSSNQQAQGGAAAAPIPVTAARAEKDAIAAAARAQSLQRRRNTDADVELARHIAAALHAPPSIPEVSLNFTWAVGVTTEGQILAANPYGIGYIPAGVHLPDQVVLVSADESIPASTRGRWVNDPYNALLGWSNFHGKELRLVLGTEEDFQRSKFASAPTIVLTPEDIPTNGTMKGRSRLEVVAPQSAARLAALPGHDLLSCVPPPPVNLVAPDPKETQRLWFDAVKPLLRTTGTNGPYDHLTALLTYAVHAQHEALYRAYTAPYNDAQRAAIADAFYWQTLWSLFTDALNLELDGLTPNG